MLALPSRRLQVCATVAQNETMTVRILGIESSCDETAAAVVADGREILSSVIASQIDVHRKYGGVVPELASRDHIRRIDPLLRDALARAGLQSHDLGAIAYTAGPGESPGGARTCGFPGSAQERAQAETACGMPCRFRRAHCFVSGDAG